MRQYRIQSVGERVPLSVAELVRVRRAGERIRILTNSATNQSTNARAGIATVWLILMLPVLFLLLCCVVEIGNLWLARAELETALESAALAAAKEWGDASGASGTGTPRQVAQTFAAANPVRGQTLGIAANYNSASLPNQNAASSGTDAQLVFGAITSLSPTVIFNAAAAPGCGGGGSTTASTSKVLFDVSAGRSLEADDAWGINFQPPAATTPANLTIRQVVINLLPTGGSDPGFDASFDFSTNPPVISNNSPNKVALQNDVFGLRNGALVLTTSGHNHWRRRRWRRGSICRTCPSRAEHPGHLQFAVRTIFRASRSDRALRLHGRPRTRDSCRPIPRPVARSRFRGVVRASTRFDLDRESRR